MPIIDSVSLEYREGSSDKEYHAQIVEESGAYAVNFQYGRRGSSLNAGSKTPRLVPYGRAKDVFDKLVNEKLSKGYRRAESAGAAQVYSAAPVQVDDAQTDFRPQLLNAIDEDRLEEVIKDSDWIFGEKMDGKRITIRKDASGTVAINRKGKIVSIPQDVIDEINRIPRDITIDGELVGSKYYAFDVVSFGGAPNTVGFGKRLVSLLKIGAAMNWEVHPNPTDCCVSVIPGYDQEAEKRAFVKDVRASKGEGVVCKYSQAPYSPGRPNSGGPALKYKFTATATCAVDSRETGKRSVSLTLLDGNFAVKRVGKVTILPNFDIPKPGDLVEVRYLYAYPNGSLYQPIYLGVRDDLNAPDDYKSLKFKQGSGEEDDEA